MSNLRFLLLFVPFIVCMALSACGDDDTTTPPDTTDPTDTTMVDTAGLCFLLFDENGQPFGTHGDCPQAAIDEQWSNIQLSAAQLALFDFTDTSAVAGPEMPTISGVAIYPNPISSSRNFALQLLSSETVQVKMKLVFTDTLDVAISRLALPVPANAGLAYQLNPDDFPFGQPYRLYYQILGNADTEVLFQGYGNILLCDSQPPFTDIEGQCF